MIVDHLTKVATTTQVEALSSRQRMNTITHKSTANEHERFLSATEANIKRFSDNKHRNMCRKLRELLGRPTVQTEVPRIDIFDRGHRQVRPRPDPPERRRERPVAGRETTINLSTPLTTTTRQAVTTTRPTQQLPEIVKNASKGPWQS